MVITAKFDSLCPSCSKPIRAGEEVEWERGLRARHPTCPRPAGGEPPKARKLFIHTVGRRHYIRGEAAEIRVHLKAGGCRWDPDLKGWWVRSRRVAQALVNSLALIPVGTETASADQEVSAPNGTAPKTAGD